MSAKIAIRVKLFVDSSLDDLCAIASRVLLIVTSKTAVLKLNSIEPQGFDESISGVQRRLE